MDTPVIETERLTLRAHQLSDFDSLAEMWADPEVVRFIGGKPFTREETWTRLLRYLGHWKLLGFGYWAVELRESGRFIGDVGFGNWQRDITPSLDGLAEGGWAFSPSVCGRGIASEAVGAALAWMDKRFDRQTTTCIIGADNAASTRVAEKNGYREFACSEFKGAAVIQFRR